MRPLYPITCPPDHLELLRRQGRGVRPRQAADRIARLASSGSSTNVHAANVATGAAPAATGTATATPLAALLTQHIVRDGEVILLALRPSLWFIVLSSIRFIAAIATYLLAIGLYSSSMSDVVRVRAIEAGLLLLAGRITWAVIQWVSRLYILTNLRILRLSGVFYPDVFDCPLRRVARARLSRPVRERLLGLGSIEIIPLDEKQPIGVWQTIARPVKVHEQVIATINRAKQGTGGCSFG